MAKNLKEIVIMQIIPMVVTTVVEKKRACPKVQFGSLVAFRKADIPFALAFSTSSIKSSNSSSANESEKTETDYYKQHVFS